MLYFNLAPNEQSVQEKKLKEVDIYLGGNVHVNTRLFKGEKYLQFIRMHNGSANIRNRLNIELDLLTNLEQALKIVCENNP